MTDEYECGDCGMQSDDWAEFRAHRIDKHLAYHSEHGPEQVA